MSGFIACYGCEDSSFVPNIHPCPIGFQLSMKEKNVGSLSMFCIFAVNQLLCESWKMN